MPLASADDTKSDQGCDNATLAQAVLPKPCCPSRVADAGKLTDRDARVTITRAPGSPAALDGIGRTAPAGAASTAYTERGVACPSPDAAIRIERRGATPRGVLSGRPIRPRSGAVTLRRPHA